MKEQRYRERPTLTDRFMCSGKLPRILGNWYGQVINMSGIKVTTIFRISKIFEVDQSSEFVLFIRKYSDTYHRRTFIFLSNLTDIIRPQILENDSDDNLRRNIQQAVDSIYLENTFDVLSNELFDQMVLISSVNKVEFKNEVGKRFARNGMGNLSSQVVIRGDICVRLLRKRRNKSSKRAGRSGCNDSEGNEPPGWCIYATVALVAVGCYLNALGGDFVHDDIPAVVRNKDVLAQNPWTSILKDDFWGTPMHDINSHKSYRPLTTLTFREFPQDFLHFLPNIPSRFLRKTTLMINQIRKFPSFVDVWEEQETLSMIGVNENTRTT
ncbi:hypothetical protein E2986_11746 [Frieseomelitta varia]|uniref:Uncharacterized protein n=1 Tax=Frieseomelitta varia TaxID=561572 RepID=A0A833W0S4_9HYME|nr:hypothetical protein E2986_11746 [Frieseomelitta varia]